MDLTAEELRRRLAVAGLEVSLERAAALLAGARGVEAGQRELRAARLGATEPAPVFDPAAEVRDDGH